MANCTMKSYSTLAVSMPSDGVVHVELNRPDKLNAMNQAFFPEMRALFDALASDDEVRAVVLSGRGRVFSAGLDLRDAGSAPEGDDVARQAWYWRRHVLELQEAFNAVERCPKPVIACVHSAAVGGAIDLIAACDVRLAAADASFCVKEVQVGIAADLGTLQRLPKVMGNQSLVRELSLTGRKMAAAEALSCGLVSGPALHADRAACVAAGLAMAADIAALSPVAVQTTKVQLNFAREHTTAEGLDYVATFNGAMLQSEDVMLAMRASLGKTKAEFSKL